MTIVARSRVDSTTIDAPHLDAPSLVKVPTAPDSGLRPVFEPSSVTASWALTRSISPRNTVRVARRDAYGQIVNEYDSTHRILGPAPDTPWAVYLADTDGWFHLLGIDLDAKNDEQAAVAGAEALAISRHLDAVGIEHVVCQSGQAGGRHLWIALAEPRACQMFVLFIKESGQSNSVALKIP